MAVTEVRLGPEQLAGCVALSAAAGWNQNAADWQLMLELGAGWGLALADGTLVASTLVLPYGTFAWISMVLVLPEHRRQGFASRFLSVAINHLESQERTAVLDATPAGREVYRQEGFRDACARATGPGFSSSIAARSAATANGCYVHSRAACLQRRSW